MAHVNRSQFISSVSTTHNLVSAFALVSSRCYLKNMPFYALLNTNAADFRFCLNARRMAFNKIDEVSLNLLVASSSAVGSSDSRDENVHQRRQEKVSTRSVHSQNTRARKPYKGNQDLTRLVPILKIYVTFFCFIFSLIQRRLCGYCYSQWQPIPAAFFSASTPVQRSQTQVLYKTPSFNFQTK